LRLPAYAGVMAARVAAEQDRSGTGQSTKDRKEVPLSQVESVHPDIIERSPRV